MLIVQENRVLRLTATGLSAKEIAEKFEPISCYGAKPHQEHQRQARTAKSHRISRFLLVPIFRLLVGRTTANDRQRNFDFLIDISNVHNRR